MDQRLVKIKRVCSGVKVMVAGGASSSGSSGRDVVVTSDVREGLWWLEEMMYGLVIVVPW